ncbi:hypothetical protein D3C78_1034710 [compost metagenome]
MPGAASHQRTVPQSALVGIKQRLADIITFMAIDQRLQVTCRSIQILEQLPDLFGSWYLVVLHGATDLKWQIQRPDLYRPLLHHLGQRQLLCLSAFNIPQATRHKDEVRLHLAIQVLTQVIPSTVPRMSLKRQDAAEQFLCMFARPFLDPIEILYQRTRGVIL